MISMHSDHLDVCYLALGSILCSRCAHTDLRPRIKNNNNEHPSPVKTPSSNFQARTSFTIGLGCSSRLIINENCQIPGIKPHNAAFEADKPLKRTANKLTAPT